MRSLFLILTLAAGAFAANWFKSAYEPGIVYSQGWYGTLDYAPPATVVLYDDSAGFCIGYMEGSLPPVPPR